MGLKKEDGLNFAAGGSGGGGSARFPTIVTSSGSSLPVDLTGYNEGDTFLNTSDKKIYQAGSSGYQLSDGTTNTDNNVVIDFETGIASNFGMTVNQYVNIYRQIFRSDGFQWAGNKTIDIHFKLSGTLDSSKYYPLLNATYTGYIIQLFLKADGLYFTKYKNYQTDFEFVSDTKILDFSWQTNTEYYLRLDKVSGNTTISLSNVGYDTNNIKKETVEIADFYGQYSSANTTTVLIGTTNSRLSSSGISYYNGVTPIEVYLLDTTTKNYLVPSSALSWDSGTDLTDKTEYADKTNGALYLYENSELVKIGSSAPTVLTDQTATSMALAGNTIYKWTSALTSLSFASAEVSDLETVLYFTTGGTIQFQDSSSLKWGGDGTAPSLEANTIYCISIRNGLAEIDTFGTVS